MHDISKLAVCVAAAAIVCGGGCTPDPAPATVPSAAVPAEPTPEGPEILPHPFTAEQIRDEMVVGSVIVVSTGTPGSEQISRWTVVAADSNGVDIEFTPVDASGHSVGEPTVQHSTWVELRNHASFPADRTTRDDVVRHTELGELEGWLYTVRDDEAATVTEFFFASDLPGAPVHMAVRRGGDVVMEMKQLSRSRPPE